MSDGCTKKKAISRRRNINQSEIFAIAEESRKYREKT